MAHDHIKTIKNWLQCTVTYKNVHKTIFKTLATDNKIYTSGIPSWHGNQTGKGTEPKGPCKQGCCSQELPPAYIPCATCTEVYMLKYINTETNLVETIERVYLYSPHQDMMPACMQKWSV